MFHRVIVSSPETSTQSALMTEELAVSTSRTLMLCIGCVYLICHTFVTPTWPDLYGLQMWALAIVLLPTTGLALHVLGRHLLLAQALWQIGLLAAITMAVQLFRNPELAWLYILLPLVATTTICWQAGLGMEVVILLLLWAQRRSAPELISALTWAGIAMGGALTGLVGWASSRALYTVTQWALSAQEQAREHMLEAQERRAALLGVVKDLDQAYYRLERTNAALAAAWRAADEAERSKAAFATSLSHELRTPLNLIIGFSEMMLTSPESYGGVVLPGPYRHDLESICHNSQHLLDLVGDVLDMARIEMTKIVLACSESSLDDLIAEVVAMVSDYVAAKGLDLRVRMAPDLPVLHIDRLRVRQVLLNLLVNAARFTEKGAITIEAESTGDEVLIRISDTGQGIRVEDLPRIFEEFHSTSDTVTSGWPRGTGLGLPISKKLIQLHGGQIGVQSTYMHGTTFWFTLPCQRQEAQQGPPQLFRPKPPDGPKARQRVLIVVHQDPRVAPMLQRYAAEYDVVGVKALDAGVKLAAELSAVGIIVDSRQPRPTLSGCLPTVICRLPDYRQTAHTIGALDLLIKPISREDLQDALDRLDGSVEKILIVDDDPEMVSLIRRMLHTHIQAGNCWEAYGGQEALRIMRAEKPDLVLLDLLMPGMDGRTVLKEMSRDRELLNTKVIVITAEITDDWEVRDCDEIVVRRREGFRLGEMARVLGAVFGELTPGWR